MAELRLKCHLCHLLSDFGRLSPLSQSPGFCICTVTCSTFQQGHAKEGPYHGVQRFVKKV